MRIEPYDPSHLDPVVHLSLRAWAPVFVSLKEALAPEVWQSFYPDGWQVSQEKSVQDACTSADMKLWVALDAKTPVGFVAVRLHKESSLGEIYMIAVDPDHQRRGIAAALTEVAIASMKEAGMSIAMVETGGDPGHGPARGLYAHAGFRALPLARYFKKL
jgi:ribosomal protein S18 acetylase RimI-like enzyme